MNAHVQTKILQLKVAIQMVERSLAGKDAAEALNLLSKIGDDSKVFCQQVFEAGESHARGQDLEKIKSLKSCLYWSPAQLTIRRDEAISTLATQEGKT